MTLDEMFDRIIIETGQFQIPRDRVELDIPRFKTLVERVVGIYNGYSPVNIHLYKNLTSRQYTFTAENTPEGIPEYIVEAIPVRISGVVPFLINTYNRPTETVSPKIEYPYVYRKPTLTVPASAEYDLHVLLKHKVTRIPDSDTESYEVVTISDDEDEFIDLLTAKFLIGLGRSRRAFTLQEIPLVSDAADLVSEGKELEAEAMENLIENKGKWYLAWR